MGDTNEGLASLGADLRAVVLEEEALLARALESLARATKNSGADERRRARDARDAVRALREEAVGTSADDLPGVLHELAVRQELRGRADERRLPDVGAPYIAHLRVREADAHGATVEKDYLLGHASHIDAAAGVRIIDWRVAPVAQIFYRHREGDDYEEELPGRVAEGTVTARRLVVIEAGVLTRIVGDGAHLVRDAGGRWVPADRAALALRTGGAGSAARSVSLGTGAGHAAARAALDVTAQLDPDQFAAIAAAAETPLLVLGSAGSGKTTVALHRLARIAASDPARRSPRSCAVVVPEEGLARLARRLLAPLGAGDVGPSVQTLDAWAIRLAGEVFGKLPRVCPETPALVSSLKRHPALHRTLTARFAALAPSRTTLKGLRRRLADVFTDRALLERVVAGAEGDLPRTAIEETVRHTMAQLRTPLSRELRDVVDPARKVALDGRAIDDATPDALAGTIDVEDLPILLFLRVRALGDAGLAIAGAPPIGHLVLDEAEDFSLFDLTVLGRQLEGDAPSVTLAGDEAQQTSSSFAGWTASLSALGVAGASTCRLALSYRCPQPIVDLAQEILGAGETARATRAAAEAAPVGTFSFPDESQAHLFLAGAVHDLVAREPRASVGVIARDEAAARRVHARLDDEARFDRDGAARVRLVTRGEFSFAPGVDVTHVDEAKGLEWDYVIVPDATREAYPATAEARRRLHVAVTRASHQLWIVCGGARTPLVRFEA